MADTKQTEPKKPKKPQGGKKPRRRLPAEGRRGEGQEAARAPEYVAAAPDAI